IWPATRDSWPAIRSENIQRSPPQERSPLPTPRASCASAVARCRRQCRSASAPWRHCLASTSIRRQRLRRRLRKAKFARLPTTMVADRSWSPSCRRAVGRGVEIAKEMGARRAMMLSVSAPFHCALMQPAADAMAAALATVEVKRPVVPVVANALVKPVSDPPDIVRALVAQVTGTVRWRESVVLMAAAGVTTFYEVGAGKVLSGLVRRIVDGARAVSIGTPEDIAMFGLTNA